MTDPDFKLTAGWDIGGAHLKLAVRRQDTLEVYQWPCPLWRGLDELVASLNIALAKLGKTSCQHHVTMTGELVDIFDDRSHGVSKILNTFVSSIPAGSDIKIFTNEKFLGLEQALANSNLVASANWLASGKILAQFCKNALFVDMGSTTTDILLVQDGETCNVGYSDAERLRSGELVYTGIVRSCVNTITHHMLYGDQLIPMMAENFANTGDVYRILELLPDHADNGESMDGKEKNKPASARRLARMIGEDYTPTNDKVWQRAATYIAEKQKAMLAKQIMKKLAQLPTDKLIVGAGVGRFLIQQIAEENGVRYINFAEKLTNNELQFADHASDCAPAVALALL